MERRLLTLLAETPVHAGGPESLAAVDLPIQREAATGLPVIWGQSLKGALRQAWRDAKLPGQEAAFGSPPPREASGAEGSAGEGALTKGAISIGDAQLVLFPAATMREVFGWVTAPLLLSRLGRKLRLLGTDPGAAFTVPAIDGVGLGSLGWEGRQVIGPFLQNIECDARAATIGRILAGLVCPDGDAAFGFTRRKLAADVLVVEDSTIDGLARMGTDVVARVQLEEGSKKVGNGPFYSEHLPAETVLAALLTGSAEHLTRLATLLDGQPIQLGGDETIGKGVLWCRVHSTESSAAAIQAAAAVPPGDAAEPAAAQLPAGEPAATPPPAAVEPAAAARATPPTHGRPSPAAMPGRKRA
ncbi:MAG: type III-B CRISPR module RAMP protein Cmr4 [Pseudonocardiaceae bacterium]